MFYLIVSRQLPQWQPMDANPPCALGLGNNQWLYHLLFPLVLRVPCIVIYKNKINTVDHFHEINL